MAGCQRPESTWVLDEEPGNQALGCIAHWNIVREGIIVSLDALVRFLHLVGLKRRLPDEHRVARVRALGGT